MEGTVLFTLRDKPENILNMGVLKYMDDEYLEDEEEEKVIKMFVDLTDDESEGFSNNWLGFLALAFTDDVHSVRWCSDLAWRNYTCGIDTSDVNNHPSLAVSVYGKGATEVKKFYKELQKMFPDKIADVAFGIYDD